MNILVTIKQRMLLMYHTANNFCACSVTQVYFKIHIFHSKTTISSLKKLHKFNT